VYDNTSIQIAGNQILNDLSSSSVVAVSNQTNATAQVRDNQFWGLSPDQIAAGPNTQSTNQFLDSEPTLDTTSPWDTAASVDPQSTLPLLSGDIAVLSAAIGSAADQQIATSGSDGGNWQRSVPDSSGAMATTMIMGSPSDTITGNWPGTLIENLANDQFVTAGPSHTAILSGEGYKIFGTAGNFSPQTEYSSSASLIGNDTGVPPGQDKWLVFGN
jgi:hypothetical protein